MVLSDAFTTSIFKQSFLRIFTKDEQGNLEMGFNATFDVQVGLPPPRNYPRAVPNYSLDYKRTQSLGVDWARYVGQQKISLRWRNGDRYWSDVSLERQRYHT